jgi:hypothetical protein
MDRLQADESTLSERKSTVSLNSFPVSRSKTDPSMQLDVKVKTITHDLTKVKKEINDLHARKAQTAYVHLSISSRRETDELSLSQTEAELNEKLKEVMNKLLQAGADKQESERDAKLKETLAVLKRTFPGSSLSLSSLGSSSPPWTQVSRDELSTSASPSSPSTISPSLRSSDDTSIPSSSTLRRLPSAASRCVLSPLVFLTH